MKKLPIGKQEFKGLIEGDFVYVDKTDYLVSLAESTIPIFLSRPRRFGKSLMVNTFKELFRGNKELFRNTFAYTRWDFQQVHPVIRLDLSQVVGDTARTVEKQLYELIRDQAEDFNLTLTEKSAANIALRQLIKQLGRETPVVILVDEYDAPILDNLRNPDLLEIKTILRGFYKIIKASEEYIRFVFITGISKFTHVGIFSALNNLEDITLADQYASILGYTEQEIDTFFSKRINLIREQLGLTEQLFRKKMASYYNGYSWDGRNFVYNPLSILKFLNNKGKFIPYWMETGSPEYIIRYSEDKQFDISAFEQLKVSQTFLSKRDIDNASPESFLTQAGYLTIKQSGEESYTLDFPNQEVRRSFCELILNAQYAVADADILGVQSELRKALDICSIEGIVRQFKVIFSSIPYVHFDANKTEHFYTAVLLMYLQAAGFHASAERLGNKGRLDLSLHDKENVYLFELKTDSAEKAVQQIVEKNYAGAYANKTVFLIGLQINFSERNIIRYLTQDYRQSGATEKK
ncbi:MAG: AAA family ATPase [Candidatus Electrothrix sp. YB6]